MKNDVGGDKKTKRIGMDKVDEGYMQKVMDTLKEGEYRQFPLDEVNVESWRTIASRENKKAGYLKYSITRSRRLGFMAVKRNKNEQS